MGARTRRHPSTAGGDRVVWLDGELDRSSERAVDAVVDAAMSSTPDRVLLDVSRVSSIDGGGLRALLSARARADAAGIPLELAGVSPAVASAMRLCAVEELFAPR